MLVFPNNSGLSQDMDFGLLLRNIRRRVTETPEVLKPAKPEEIKPAKMKEEGKRATGEFEEPE